MQNRVFVSALVALFCAPAICFSAGFADRSIFLSQTNPQEGQTVLIHAVVSSADAFSGTLTFSDESSTIGTVPVKLASGEAQVATVSWKPTGGSHTVTAELKNASTSVEKALATFLVAAKPQPVTTASDSTSVESSQGIQQGIANLSPQAAQVTEPFFTMVDSARDSAANLINDQLNKTKASLGTDAGKVLGAEATKNATSNPGGTFWFIVQTLYLYLLTILGFLVTSAGVFYPAFAIIVLFILWRLFKRFRRPAY